MAEANAQALAMAIEIRRKNKRKAIPKPESETVHEVEEESVPLDAFDVADTVEEPVAAPAAVVSAPRPMGARDAVGMARAIMAKHKAPAPAEDNLEEEPEPAPVKSANDRIAAILGRNRTLGGT